MTKQERQAKILKNKGIIWLTSGNGFLNKTIYELENEIRCCENANEMKRTLKAHSGWLDIRYNDTNKLYNVYYKDLYIFSASKCRGANWWNIQTNIYTYTSNVKLRLIDLVKHEIREQELHTYMTCADISKKRTDFIYEITWAGTSQRLFNHRTRTRLIKIIGTNGIVLYNVNKNSLKWYKDLLKSGKKAIELEIEKTIERLNNLYEQKKDYEQKSYYAGLVQERQNNINKLLGREGA